MIHHVGSKRDGARSIVSGLAVAFVTLWTLFPFYWAVLLSFKRQGDLYSPWIIPFVQFQPTLENWRGAFADWIGYAGQITVVRSFANSALVATCTSIVCLWLGIFAAYGLAHLQREYKLRGGLLIAFLLPRFLPPIVLLTAVFVLARSLGLIDTIPGLVVFDVPLILPFAVLILHDAFRNVPRELEESAVVDGCGSWRVLWHIALPLSWPAVLAAATICFAFAWNEFPFALTLYQQNVPTMPLVVSALETKDGVEMGYVGVNVILALLPPALLSVLAQRYVVRGLTFGAVGG